MTIHLHKDEEEAIYSLAEKLTGSKQSGRWRKTVLVQNVVRRIQELGLKRLENYLLLVQRDANEFNHLVSALTIHFTSFFRESEQFEPFLKLILEGRDELRSPIRILVAACSTGEEAYSLSLFLEKQRLSGRIPDYRLSAFDIDPRSVAKGQRGIYALPTLGDIPLSYRSLVLQGSGKSEGYFTFDKQVRSKIHWFDSDLRKISDVIKTKGESPFDAVSCRNVLIYFDEKGVNKVLEQLLACLKPQGVLCLGHSEPIQTANLPVLAKGRSLYVLKQKQTIKRSESIRALVVDDSHTIRKVLSVLLTKVGFETDAVDSAENATKFLNEHDVDLITLDLNMPVMDGATWLRRQRASGLKTPVVIISDATPHEAENVLGALLGGAQDYIFKQEISQSAAQLGERLKLISEQYSQKVQNKSSKQQVVKKSHVKKFNPELIVIASSTGGTEALVSLLGLMPVDCPPILVVQHITHAFAKPFFQRLARVSGLKMGLIEQDAPVLPGHLYMAIDDYHLGVRKAGDKIKVSLSYGPPEHAVRPAADVLFRSVARAKIPSMALILTGMGKDGALGMLELMHTGSYTLAQDEESCVVFGMPREAIQLGAVSFVGNIKMLRSEIDQCLMIPKKDIKVAS